MPLTVINVGYSLAAVTPSTAGGAEQVLSMIDAALVEQGHRSIVIAPEGSVVAGELVTIAAATAPFTDEVQRAAHERMRTCLARVLATAGVDVVHMHGVDAPHVMPAIDVPAAVTVHLPCDWYPRDFFARPNLQFVCVSESQRARFPGEARLIPNGIDLQACRPAAGDGEFVLALGRICPEKNVHDAMDAAARAGVAMYVAGTVAGYGTHQAYFRDFVEPRFGDRCRFLGALTVQERCDWMASARCVLIPSTVAETSSLVAMESLACGTPVIAYRSGALPEIVRDGVTGAIVSGVQEMADAIGRIGAIDRAVCRREAERRFDRRRMAEEYIALYTTIARHAGASH